MPLLPHRRLTESVGLRILVLTDRSQLPAGVDVAAVAGAAAAAGASAVVLREKDMGRDERRRLAQSVDVALRRDAPERTRMLVASDVELAVELGADGVHLAAGDPCPASGASSAVRRGLLVGRSCHSVEEVRAAVAAGVDYVTASPVFSTRSKPGYGPALGLDGLERLVAAAVGVPVVALGGVGPGRVAACRAAGAAGVAVMGEVMRLPTLDDVTRVVGALVAEAGTMAP